MKDKYKQYFPLLGALAARREFKQDEETYLGLKDGGSIPEDDFSDFSVHASILGVANRLKYSVICAENLAALGGLAYLVIN